MSLPAPQPERPAEPPIARGAAWMLAGAACFAFVSYLERTNISITAEMMIPALGLAKVQMGEIFTAFLLGYALFQVPGGIAGDRLGPRKTLALSALVWAAMTALTGAVPSLLRGHPSAAFWSLAAIRFVLGLAEATTFPVANRVVRNWIPPGRRAMGNAIVFLGTSLASATAGPLVAALMLRLGWQRALEICALPALVLAGLWGGKARDLPPSTDPHLPAAPQPRPGSSAPAAAPTLATLLRRRNVVLLIASYVSEGYVLFIFVFWLYIYLVERRGFTMMRGGWMTAVPWLLAFLVSPLGGLACDRLSVRFGARLAGAKAVIMAGYALSGALLFLAAYARSPWMSVLSLSLSVTALMSAESSFWVSAAHLSGERVGAVSGVMNMAGIGGGIASTLLVPILTQRLGWLAAFGSGTAMALLCAALAALLRESRSGRAPRP